MRPQGVIGSPLILAFFGTRRLDSVIGIATPKMVRPTVIGTEFNLRQIVGNEVRPKHIAFIDHGPQHTVRIPIKPHRIAQTGGIRNLFARRDIEFKHPSASLFLLHSTFSNIAVRPDRDIQFLAIGRRREIASPVHVG